MTCPRSVNAMSAQSKLAALECARCSGMSKQNDWLTAELVFATTTMAGHNATHSGSAMHRSVITRQHSLSRLLTRVTRVTDGEERIRELQQQVAVLRAEKESVYSHSRSTYGRNTRHITAADGTIVVLALLHSILGDHVTRCDSTTGIQDEAHRENLRQRQNGAARATLRGEDCTATRSIHQGWGLYYRRSHCVCV